MISSAGVISQPHLHPISESAPAIHSASLLDVLPVFWQWCAFGIAVVALGWYVRWRGFLRPCAASVLLVRRARSGISAPARTRSRNVEASRNTNIAEFSGAVGIFGIVHPRLASA